MTTSDSELPPFNSQWVSSIVPHPTLNNSFTMQQVVSDVDNFAPFDIAIAIHGETGTGKELIAHQLHQKSHRSAGPFVVVNCSAITDGLFESEFFGHEKGAFTGAVNKKKGYFQQANNGTLFLDEIGDLPLHHQAKLLRIIQDQKVSPVGSDGPPQKVDVRIVVATHHNLEEMVAAGKFREDLYHRIVEASVHLPPLRDRKEDIPGLANQFIKEFAHKHGKDSIPVDSKALKLLQSYNWPGNVRELKKTIKRAFALASKVGVIHVEHLASINSPSVQQKNSTVAAVYAGFNSRQKEVFNAVVSTKFKNTHADKLRGRAKGNTTNFLKAPKNAVVKSLIEQCKQSGDHASILTALGLPTPVPTP